MIGGRAPLMASVRWWAHKDGMGEHGPYSPSSMQSVSRASLPLSPAPRRPFDRVGIRTAVRESTCPMSHKQQHGRWGTGEDVRCIRSHAFESCRCCRLQPTAAASADCQDEWTTVLQQNQTTWRREQRRWSPLHNGCIGVQQKPLCAAEG